MAIVFFGTFDPFHENHLRLIDYVAKKYHPKKIALIPNSDLPNINFNSGTSGCGFKSGALSIKHRLETARIRFKTMEPQYKYLEKMVEIRDPGPIKTNWQGRQKLACQFGKEQHLPILYVVLGLDSLVSSLARTNDNGMPNPIDKFILKVLAIPRLGYTIPEIPSKYQDKITIDHEYQEKHQISSTLVRQLIRSNLPVSPEICHPSIVEYLVQKHCYGEKKFVIPEFVLKCTEKEQLLFQKLGPVVIFMGSPGSGKTTLAQKMAESNDYLFLSTGDLYRTEQEKQSTTYKVLQKYRQNPLDFRQALGQFIIYRLHGLILEKTTSSTKGVVIEGFKASDLTHWTQHIGKVDQVIYVTVDRAKLAERVRERNLDRKDECAFEHRLEGYFNVYEGEILIEMETLQKAGQINEIRNLDNNETIEETLRQLQTIVSSK